MFRRLGLTLFLFQVARLQSESARIDKLLQLCQPPAHVRQFGGGGSSLVPSSCNCGVDGKAKTRRGPHKKTCPCSTAKDGSRWQKYATPPHPSATTRTYLEKEATPGGRHKRVVVVAAEGMDNSDRKKRRAPVLGVLAERVRDNTPENVTLKRKLGELEDRYLRESQKRLDAKKPGAIPPREPVYVHRASKFNRRPNEAETDRSTRVLGQLGTVRERHTCIRERDATLRDQLHEADQQSAPNRTWPPPRPTNVGNLSRLQEYFKQLETLGDRIQICSNCCEKDVNLGVGDGVGAAATECWFCREKPEVLHWENGLDLNLDPRAGPDGTNTDMDKRQAFHELEKKWAPLSPVEQALISPVVSCFTVLKLPSGGQLGYRGNVINFTYDVAKVSARAQNRSFEPFNDVSLLPRGFATATTSGVGLWDRGLSCALQEAQQR